DLDTTNTVFHQHADMRYPAIVGFLFVGQRSFGWLLLGLQDDYARQRETLKPTILSQNAPLRQLILRFIRNPFIMRFPFIRGAQEPDGPVCIHNHHVFDGMVFFLATVVDFLFIGISRPRYRSLCAIMAKKGGASGSTSAVSACNWAVNSAAVRAGSKRWLAKAVFKISSNSCTHLLTFD